MCYAGGVPRFQPFRALRYNSALAPLADVVAPPYDVVDADERARLVARSPYNSIRVELPVADPDRGLDRYEAAAALLAAWQAEGVLARDPSPALYVYKMGFRDDAGRPRTTTGVIGALGLEPSGGAVVPHEQTMAAPGRDRLRLLRACRVNSSPIWGLSLAPGLTAACAAATATASDHVQTTDDEETTHEMWPIADESAIRALAALIAPAPVVIADGHHRHETAMRYRAECRARTDAPGDHDFLMAFVAELAPDELGASAIHRLVTGLPEGFDLPGEFGRAFRLEPAADDAVALGDAMAARSAPALVTAEGTWLLLSTTEGPVRAAEPDSGLVDEFLARLPRHGIAYQHDADRARAAVRAGRAQAAVLVRPPTAAQLAGAVRAGVRMPPKSTYFFPKPRTGFVFRPLDR
ncbi:MAG TPA: DUF1015 domain-containing protein [Acidimicrobiales bacterium]|nr:DUF1015 domain-containing protein [Acidimicrobiales bacterium]